MLKYGAPAWYELDWNGKSLFLRVNEPVIDRVVRSIASDQKVVFTVQQELELSEFVLPQGNCAWGFNNAIVPAESHKRDWLSFRIDLPVVFDSRGNWDNHAYGVAASLQIIFDWLRFCYREGSAGQQLQLLVIDEFCVGKYQHGGSFSASLSPELVAWIDHKADHWDQVETPVVVAMQTAYGQLRQEMQDGWRRDFKCRTDGHGLSLSCFGDACDLGPDNPQSSRQGYTINTHNCEGPLEQLTLLVGLAELCRLARVVEPPIDMSRLRGR